MARRFEKKKKQDYIMFMLEAKTNSIANNINTRICDTMMKNDDIINLDNVKFAKLHGDILYTFKCPEK